MLTETSELTGLEVYTHTGLLLGAVEDLVFDSDKQNVYGLFVEKTNPVLVEHSTSVVVPFRWIEGIGDIIILRYFPGFINSDGKPEHLPFLKKLGKDLHYTEDAAEHLIQDIEHVIDGSAHHQDPPEEN